MDEKLARGRARELFRNLAKRSTLATSPSTPIIIKMQEAYLVRGGVDESRLKSFVQDLENEFNLLPQIGASSYFVRHPVKSKAVLEVTRPSSIIGTEQPWIVSAANTYIFQRNVLKLIETVHSVAVSQHAIFRLFERGDMKSDSIVGLLDSVTLWVPTLLSVLFGATTAKGTNGTQVAIPFSGGLLLGEIEFNHLDGPEQGPTITDYRRGGHKLRRLKAPFELDPDTIPTISINTYVSNDELFDNQKDIVRKLSLLADRFRDTMTKIRTLSVLGYPDAEVEKLLGPAPVDESDMVALGELVDLIRSFFETPDWKTHTEAHRGRSVRTIQ